MSGFLPENEIRRLISKFTGFEENERKFQLCFNYTKSNLQFHHYLDVNKHQIEETIDRLCQTFRVRGRATESKRFLELTSQFINSPVCKEHAKADTSYAVLSFLIRLSRNTNFKDDIDELLACVGNAGPVDKAPSSMIRSWHNLLEDEEPFRASLEDSEYLDGDDVDEIASIDALPEEDIGPRCDSGIGDPSDVRLTSPSQSVVTGTGSVSLHDGRRWLQQNLIPPYWCNHFVFSDREPRSQVFSAQFAKKWLEYQDVNSLIKSGTKNIILSERLLLREVIWMLQGIKSTHAFIWKENHFEPREDLLLSHVTPPSLTCLLKEFCEYGTFVAQVKDFVRAIAHSTCSAYGRCQTYQAYAVALDECLDHYLEDLLEVERVLLQQEITCTLSNLLKKMGPRFEELDELRKLHREGIQDAPNSEPTWKLALRLLGVVYRHLLVQNSLSLLSDKHESMILPLFLKTCKPYLDTTDRLLVQGLLEDPYSEFVIQRKESVKLLDEHFWSSALSILQIPEELAKDFFLRPFLPDIIVAGKSMEMLRHLGHLHEVETELSQTGVQGSLFSNFVDNMQSMKTDELDPVDTEYNPKQSNIPRSWTENGVILQCRAEFSDDLLYANFENIVNLFNQEPGNDDSTNISSCMPTAPIKSLPLMIQEALTLIIKERCQKAWQKLVEVLKEDHHLINHFTALRNVFLMEEGDGLSEFCSEIFKKLLAKESTMDERDLNILQLLQARQNPDDGQRLLTLLDPSDKGSPEQPFQHLEKLLLARQPCLDEMDLNILLQTVLARQQLEDERLFVVLEEGDKPEADQPLHYLERIRLNYNVPWPVNVVINSHSQKIYGQVFCFLLQLKCAKYALDELRFSDLSRGRSLSGPSTLKRMLKHQEAELPNQQKIHAMHILRFVILHFINSFHTYIMTKILSSAQQELFDQVMKADHLDDILQLHLRFLVELQDTCLFQPHLKHIRECIRRVFQLALYLQKCWRNGISKTKTRHLLNIHNKFNQCHDFLKTYLTNPVFKSCSHMEALHFALQAQGSVPCVVWQP